MKEVQITMYEAVDGQKFDDAKACVEHDLALLDQLLGTLTQAEIKTALRKVGLLIRNDRAPPAPPLPAETEARLRKPAGYSGHPGAGEDAPLNSPAPKSAKEAA
jgi:dihydrodipicolinate synthase/N-acetylneuraminate lyase